MIQTDNTFKTSINIKFDFGKSDLVSRYLPTSSHADSLKGLLNGFIQGGSPTAHMVIGPYGTGKSLLGTIVTGLVSKELDHQIIEELVEKYTYVDDEIYKSLKEVRSLDKVFIPVILNGNEGSFRMSIMSALSKVLQETNSDIILPGVVNQIASTIQLWEETYKQTYQEFLNRLKVTGKQLDLWMTDLMSYDQEAIRWFSEIYPLLTSGSEFVANYRDGFIEQLQHVLEQLEKRNMGIFIVYDEFGRFLQTLENSQLNQTMQDLQDLAELSNHYSNSLHVLLITHRNMRNYALKQGEELQKEFQRIEKRYAVYYVESDEDTFVRLSQSVIAQYKLEHTTSMLDINTIKNGLLKFPLFPKMNATEIENLVVYGAYPMHPVTLYLLPKLSNLLAQNERTLFTFLESKEKGGLQYDFQKSHNWYFAYKLFDFFYPNLNKHSYSEVDETHIDLYKRIILRISGIVNQKLCRELIQFVTLWNITGLQSRFKLTDDFIAFAFNWDSEKLYEVLKVLQELKVIRYNRVLEQWELFEGSSINIDELINQKKSETTLSRKEKLEVIEKSFPVKHYFSTEYNNEKSMTRFAKVVPLYSSQIKDKEIDFERLRLSSQVDAQIINVIFDATDDYEKIKQSIIGCSDEQTLFCLSNLNANDIDEYLVNSHTIEVLINDPEILKQDPLLNDELLIKKSEIKNDINRSLQPYSRFSKDLKWLHKGKEREFINEYTLSNYLSNLMFKLYPETPEIRNDSFNRRFINNVQKKAGIKVLDHLLTDFNKKNIGLIGQGPEYLIYATTFKNNNLHVNDLDKIENEHYCRLREKLLEALRQSPQGSLIDLVNILGGKPFGIRPPLVPLLFLGLLRDEWDKLMLYRNNMYVSEVNGEAIYKIFENAGSYDYRYVQLDNRLNEMFDEIERLFTNTEDLEDYQPKQIRISSKLLKWLRGLPRITQMTTNVSLDAQHMKMLIKQSEVDPQLVLDKLYDMHKRDSLIFNRVKEELEHYDQLHLQELGNIILKHFDVEEYPQLLESVSDLEAAIKKNNALIKTITTSNSENWVDNVAYCLVGVERKNWSDTTNQMFKTQLLNEGTKLKERQVEYEHIVEIQVNGETKVINEVELSEKSQAIYQNARRLLRNAGRTVPKEEIEYLIWKLFQEAVE